MKSDLPSYFAFLDKAANNEVFMPGAAQASRILPSVSVVKATADGKLAC